MVRGARHEAGRHGYGCTHSAGEELVDTFEVNPLETFSSQYLYAVLIGRSIIVSL